MQKQTVRVSYSVRAALQKVLRIRDVYPGYRIRAVYPGSEFFYPGSRVKKIPDPGSGSASKNLSILSLKIVSKLSEI
jgi:hypothetical protein